jgi:GAF domain-containing protein
MKQNFPLLVAPTRHEDLTGVLGNVHAPYLEEGLDDLADAVAGAIGRKTGLSSWSKARGQFLLRWPELRQNVKDRAQVSREEYDRVLNRVTDLEGRLRAAEETLREATNLGEKYSYFLAILPELIQGVNSVFLSSDDSERRSKVLELEYMTSFHAGHLYNRFDLRSVIWHEEKGHLRRGKAIGPWAGGQPALNPLRESRLREGPLQHGEDVWVDDPAAAEHAETAELGSGDKRYPSFLLASMLAGQQNYGLLQLEASGNPPLNADDLEVVRLLAALLASGLAALTQQQPTAPTADPD